MAKRKATAATIGFKDKYEEMASLEKNGLLKPEAVVRFAADPETHLHKHFTWDDTKAANQYRLDQARAQIRMYVMVVEGPKGPVQIRAYHSLPSDRMAGGGYRPTRSILEDKELVAELVASAIKELALVREKYEAVSALAPVWAAAEAVAAAHPVPAKAARAAA